MALAADVAIVAAGVTWYLNPTVGWRWCQQRRIGLSARSVIGPKRACGVTSAAPATDSERCLSSSSKFSACDADANPRRTLNDILAAQDAKPELAPEDPRTDEGRSRTHSFSAARDTEPERGFRFCPLASDGNANDPNTARMPRVAGATVQASDAPPDCLGTHLLALPDEVLVLILVSRAGNVNTRRAGRVLAGAGACCKAFASIVHEAATVFAGHHGWRLESLAGGMPILRYLSKLAQDTRRVQYKLRQQPVLVDSASRPEPTLLGPTLLGPTFRPTIHGSGRFRHLAFVDLWVTEMSRGVIGALRIDAQVRRQHTLELGAYLIKLAIDSAYLIKLAKDSQGNPERPGNTIIQVCAQLEGMMMQPDSPLDASWLAAHVMVPPANIQHFLNELPHPIFRMGLLLRDELMWLYTYGGATAFDTVRSSFCAVYH